MKGVFCHLSLKSLGDFSSPCPLLCEPSWSALLEQTLSSWSFSKGPDQIIFICPEGEGVAIKEKLIPFIERDGFFDFLEIPSEFSWNFGKDNALFNALWMTVEEFYGAWNCEGFEWLVKHFSFKKAIVLNLEDFWFLKGKDFEDLFACLDEDNLKVTLNNSQGSLVGFQVQSFMNVFREFKAVAKKQNREVEENFDRLTQEALPALADRLKKGRSDYFRQEGEKRYSISKLLYKTFEVSEGLARLQDRIRFSRIGVSFRERRGQEFLRSLMRLSDGEKNFDEASFLRHLQLPNPRRVVIDLSGELKGDFLSSLRCFEEVFSEVVCWTIKCADKGFEDIQKVLMVIGGNKGRNIYLEGPMKAYDSNVFQSLWDLGVNFFVFDLDAFSYLSGGVERAFVKMGYRVSEFADWAGKDLNKKLLLKVSSSFDKSWWGAIIFRFTGFCEGIVFEDERSPFTAGPRDPQNIFPFEVLFDSHGFSSLYQGGVKSKISSWEEYCLLLERERLEKGDSLSMLLPFSYSMSPLIRSREFLSKLEWGRIEGIKVMREENDFKRALNSIEMVLKRNPSSSDVWKELDLIEENIKKSPFP